METNIDMDLLALTGHKSEELENSPDVDMMSVQGETSQKRETPQQGGTPQQGEIPQQGGKLTPLAPSPGDYSHSLPGKSDACAHNNASFPV